MTRGPLSFFHANDPGIALFRASMEAGAPMAVTPGMRVLEVGCCESRWLHQAHEAFPEVEFVGVDWRATDAVDGDGKVTQMQGNGLNPDLFPPAPFDAVVSLSAIEHFGLGHYARDPIDPDGDSKVVANIWRWLKPGGWFYFDVPYDPTKYWVWGTKCRVYDDDALEQRLAWTGVRRWAGYADCKPCCVLLPKPTQAHPRFWCVAQVWEKA